MTSSLSKCKGEGHVAWPGKDLCIFCTLKEVFRNMQCRTGEAISGGVSGVCSGVQCAVAKSQWKEDKDLAHCHTVSCAEVEREVGV